MIYNDLYKRFKAEIPEGSSFYKEKEEEYLIDETDGMHVVFGMVIAPYILDIVKNKRINEIYKVFEFLENMASCENEDIVNVLYVSVLEYIIDNGYDMLSGQCKKYMKKNTLKLYEEAEQWFFL